MEEQEFITKVIMTQEVLSQSKNTQQTRQISISEHHKYQKNVKSILVLSEQLKCQEKWNFSSKKRSQQQLIEILKEQVTLANLKYFWLHWNKMPRLVSLISNPIFPKLKILNIGGNFIETLEPLYKVKMPSLEELWLWNNKIVKVDSIRKIQAPNLRIIDLSSNLIVEATKLYQINSALERINIQQNKFSHITHFVKILARRENSRINLIDNDIVTIFKHPNKKGKKIAESYEHSKNTVSYC